LASRTRGTGAKQIEDLIEATNVLIAQSNILISQIGGVQNPVSADIVSPTTVLNGQVTLTGTPARDPLVAVATVIKSVTVENPNTNAVVYVGNATVIVANGHRLQPAASVSMDIDDLNKVYVTGTAGQVVSWIAVN
jgi:hypothetical protein